MTVAFPRENDVEVGESIPPMTEHAVSVSLPTWKANVGYEEGEDWVVSKMKTGYPRFFVHKSIEAFANAIVSKHGQSDERAMLFPTHVIADRCRKFVLSQAPELEQKVRILDLVPSSKKERSEELAIISPQVSAFLFPGDDFKIAKQFWQHSGEGVSSRRAEYCHGLFDKNILVDSKSVSDSPRPCKGPRRYQTKASVDLNNSTEKTNGNAEPFDPTLFVEERFGRNLDISMTRNAKLAVRRRIAGSLTENVSLAEAVSAKESSGTGEPTGRSEDDVYLYPCGMSSIYNTHRLLTTTREPRKSIVYGFPYIDTLKIVEKFGPGSQFYGFGNSEELDDLEKRLEGGERFLALFTEFPGNPQLRSPNLARIRTLADKYDFIVVVDETIGNFLNINVLQYADVVVSSLTKIFSGDSNVMGGSLVLNPKGKNYKELKRTWTLDYEDNHWAEDSIVLERNSRDFVSRIERINLNAEAICDVLRAHPCVSKVYYPKYSETRPYYDKCRTEKGGYGGLLSVVFQSKEQSVTFFDSLDAVKGPSLGTNFTLSSPYVILAHYGELDWVASWGVEAELVRVSVGLEETTKLVAMFQRALDTLST